MNWVYNAKTFVCFWIVSLARYVRHRLCVCCVCICMWLNHSKWLLLLTFHVSSCARSFVSAIWCTTYFTNTYKNLHIHTNARYNDTRTTHAANITDIHIHAHTHKHLHMMDVWLIVHLIFSWRWNNNNQLFRMRFALFRRDMNCTNEKSSHSHSLKQSKIQSIRQF